jgi:hypothetical protein
MDETTWLACTSIDPLLEFAGNVRRYRGHVSISDRKLRLFACGCYRRLWATIPPEPSALDVLHACERYADGLAERNEMYLLRKQYPEERMLIAKAYDAAQVSATYCLNRIWDHIGGDNYHPNDYKLYSEEKLAQPNLLRDITGNPIRRITLDPRWQTETVVALATGIYAERAFDRMPILADALEDAGCDHADILNHCRGDGPHVRGCWVVDLVLGKV